MSVAVSGVLVGGRCPPSGEESILREMDGWRRDVRARVTALKCHVMATRGLSPDGHIVSPYDPDVLLKATHNAQLLVGADQQCIKEYVATAMQNLPPPRPVGKGKRSSPNGSRSVDPECDLPPQSPELAPEDVHLRLVDSQSEISSCNSSSPVHFMPLSSSPSPPSSSPSSPSSNLQLYSEVKLLSQTPNNSMNGTIYGTTIGSNEELNCKHIDTSDDNETYNKHETYGGMSTKIKSTNCSSSSFQSNSTPFNSPVKLSNHLVNGVVQNTDIITVNQNSNNSETINKLSNVENEVNKLKKELRQKEEEVDKLSRIRDEVENELQELTANLFQEAHGMVGEANQRAASADRSLKEATMQVDVLTAEVTALKALVITSTPAYPNPHLHPQLHRGGGSNGNQEQSSNKNIFQRGHRKSPSDFDLKYGRDTTPPSSPLKEYRIQDTTVTTSASITIDPECWEVDPVAHREFVAWKQSPVLERCNPFLKRVYEEDIDLCLSFHNSTLAHLLTNAIHDNSVFIEEVNPRQKSSCPKKCVLLDVPRFCKYRFRLGEKDDHWYYISQFARNRIIAVCDFLNYLRYIQLGLVKSSIHDVYWEVVKLRRQMSLARLGF